MENKKDNKKKPLKLSSSGRLQIRKNLGPSNNIKNNQGNKKTIQIVFRNKNNQQKNSSTTQSNYRGSSSFRAPISPTFTPALKSNKNFQNRNKKPLDKKKDQPKITSLKDSTEEIGNRDATNAKKS